MKTLLIINDNSPESKHAAEFALIVAKKAGANIILANNFIKVSTNKEMVLAGDTQNIEIDDDPDFGLLGHLRTLNEDAANFKSEITSCDISDMDEDEVAQLINRNNIWMMVKGMPVVADETAPKHQINVQTVLNKVLCPLFLIPADWKLKDLERLVYVADLRYCRLQIVRYLADFARSWHASVSIAHTSASGLPDMAEKYALSVFSEEICPNVNYDQLLFNNIRERNLVRAVDVIINGLHNDILVLVNHNFHFEEIVGRYINTTLPLHITVPLLIFPY